MEYTITWETWRSLTLELQNAAVEIDHLRKEIQELRNEGKTIEGDPIRDLGDSHWQEP